MAWGRAAIGVAGALVLICGCNEASEDADTQQTSTGGTSNSEPGDLDVGYAPGEDVAACEARFTEITVEMNGESYSLEQDRAELLDCCGLFTLTVEGCEPEGDRCFSAKIEEGLLFLTTGARADGGVAWGEELRIPAVNEPEITEWPDTRCSIDGRPQYYWVDLTSASAIGGDSISLSVAIKAYVTGADNCQC